MTALQVILSVRSRLRDEDRNRLRFSDSELLLNLEIAQNALILEFDSNILEFKFNAAQQPFRFHKRILGIHKVLLGGKEIPNKPQAYALHSNANFFYLTNTKEARLSKESFGELRVFANCGEVILDTQDTLFLDELYFNALVLGVLKQMILIETGEDNLQKVAPYNSLYNQEIARLYLLHNKSKTSKIHYTRNIKC